MGALALLAITVLLINLYQSLHRVIDSSQRELSGIEVIKPIARAVQHLQVHRELCSGVLNGNDAMQDERSARELSVREALQTATTRLPQLSDSPGWKKVLDAWALIEKDGLDLIQQENFATHNRLIDDILAFQTVVADEYALTNDPDNHSTYLIATTIEQVAAGHRAHGSTAGPGNRRV